MRAEDETLRPSTHRASDGRVRYRGVVPATETERRDASMVLVRRLLGDVLRRRRTAQGRTLREVAASARVSLGYLSEIERGRKEASSELLAAVCGALGVPMSVVLREVSDELARAELAAVGALEIRRPVPHPAAVMAAPDDLSGLADLTSSR
jgi:transcriptional regulator with XRE-family HTH domain